jgi:hypothetical protein
LVASPHSDATDLAVAAPSYLAEPERGRRQWTKTPEAQHPVYGNHRRVRGARGKQLLRCRGEYIERSFAHVYDTGGLRPTHWRGHQNILKRLWVHAGAFNRGILMRRAFWRGTPRGLQGADSASARLKSPSELSSSASGRPPRALAHLTAAAGRRANVFNGRIRLVKSATSTTGYSAPSGTRSKPGSAGITLTLPNVAMPGVVKRSGKATACGIVSSRNQEPPSSENAPVATALYHAEGLVYLLKAAPP